MNPERTSEAKVSGGSSGANGVSGEVRRVRMDLPMSYHGSELSFCDGRFRAGSLDTPAGAVLRRRAAGSLAAGF